MARLPACSACCCHCRVLSRIGSSWGRRVSLGCVECGAAAAAARLAASLRWLRPVCVRLGCNLCCLPPALQVPGSLRHCCHAAPPQRAHRVQPAAATHAQPARGSHAHGNHRQGVKGGAVCDWSGGQLFPCSVCPSPPLAACSPKPLPQPASAAPPCRRPCQALAFYERPIWRTSSNLSECITFVLDPHAFTPSGDRSIDSV